VTETYYKLQFAGLLQKVPRELRSNPQPMIAKQIVGKEDCLKFPLFVLQIAEEWIFDPLVIAEIERLDRTPIEKEIVLNELYRIGTNQFAENADRVKAFAEYAKISGWTLVKKDDPMRADDKLKELAAMILTDSELPQLDKVNG
jgi:hypothetical protein